MDNSVPTCPNCGQSVTPHMKLCPNCGAELFGVWPPPVKGDRPLAPEPPKTLTGRVWTDVMLGATGQYLIHLAVARFVFSATPSDPIEIGILIFEFFCAFVFGAIGYYRLKGIYPFVARGSGYATFALFAIILGALFTCRLLPF